MDFTTLWIAWRTVSRTMVCPSAFCHQMLQKQGTCPTTNGVILELRSLEFWEMNPCCSYIPQPYVFVRTVPAAADKFPTQILSAGSRYQYLNQTVHGCHPVSTVLGYVEGLNQRHHSLGVAWSEKVMSDETHKLITPFQTTVKGQPSFQRPGGSEWGLL